MIANGLSNPGDWCKNEFSHINFGDRRLSERFITTAERLLMNPEASVNQACIGWAETKAAYRLFDNDSVTSEAIIKAHQVHVRKRLANFDVILAIQDTTYFNFDSRPDGFAVATKKKFNDMHGIVMHHALAVTTDGTPIGELYQHLYNRNIGTKRKDHYDHQTIPFEEKESYRWVLALRESQKFLECGPLIVTVCDRESDIFEFLQEAKNLNASYVIRAAKNRSLFNGKNRNEPSQKLWDEISNQPIGGRFAVNVSRQKERKERVANVTVQYGKITLRPPRRLPSARSESLIPIEITAILVKEENPPNSKDALEWMLLTDIAVKSFKEAREKIHWYEKRWTIECYHKVMKSGFKVESCQLHTVARLNRFISLISVLAIRLHAMTNLARQHPNDSCEKVLTKEEWQALYCKINRVQNPPPIPPSLEKSTLWIAILGGYLNRKSDPPPGSIVIWRGWKRLTDITDDWILFTRKDVGKG